MKQIMKGELIEESVVRKIGNSDFSTKPTNFHNLDEIISIGYRVKSLQGTNFHRANEQSKGFQKS